VSDNNKKFHEFALQSVLFKGRSDWYFCFLKSEKIAHVLSFLTDTVSPSAAEALRKICDDALDLPSTIVHFSAGEVDAQVLLADIFALLSGVRLAGARGSIAPENAIIIAQEYEALAEKIAASVHLSPFASAEDFVVPVIGHQETVFPTSPPRLAGPTPFPTKLHLKDNKGQILPHSQGQKERLARILDFVLKNKRVSIKEISSVVRECSEKTIQRELTVLIQQGLVQRVGERRWSFYLPV